MFVERKVCYSALYTYLVRWYAGAVSLRLIDVFLGPASLTLGLNDEKDF
jgi:hypothetical protein